MAVTNRALRAGPRKAYDIRFRCILNGCDWTARLFLRSADEAFEAMYRRVRYGSGSDKYYTKDFYRVVSCDVSADQSRPTI